jgi:hypothetical protein
MLEDHLTHRFDVLMIRCNDADMRTTLQIDPEVLAAARRIAHLGSKTLGEVISELARRGLEARAPTRRHQGFPVFDVPPDAAPLTLEDVKRAEDEE